MEKQLKKLKIDCGGIKHPVTNLENLLNSISAKTDLESLGLENHLQKHLELWDEFEKIQSANESFDVISQDTVHEGERNSFEDQFYKADGKIRKFVKQIKSNSDSILVQESLISEDNLSLNVDSNLS